MMKRMALILMLIAGSLAFGQTRHFEVTITNLTKGQIFAPPVVVTYDRGYSMFELGGTASTALYTMAEDGDASGLRDEALAIDYVTDAVVGDGVIMPGQSATVVVESDGYDFLAVAGMLVTTNDGFFAIKDFRLPGVGFKRAFGPTSILAEVYDAGSEANTEDCAHIPGPPCGNPGVRVTEGAEGYIYPHPGIHAQADVDNGTYDWRGPAAKISVKFAK